MRIFVVGMPGAGNLGDDLISVLLFRHIAQRWPDAEIGILHAGFSNPLTYSNAKNMRLLAMPSRRSWNLYFGRLRNIRDFAYSSNLITVGGGGLFQDSHSRFTVHKWLRDALSSSGHRVPVAAVGVGFGPLNHAFSRWYLKKALSRFSTVQVRDEGSADIVRSLGYSACIGPDIVTGSDLRGTPFLLAPEEPSNSVIGCSIRPWPGLSFLATINVIHATCKPAAAVVRIFVFEHAPPDNTSEYDYAVRTATALEERGVVAEIICYRKDSIGDFASAFASVTMAIASRYHANILWQKLGIPVLPISYAPKVARLYEERGRYVTRVDRIEQTDASPRFQTIDLRDEYSLPSDAELFRAAQFDAHYLRALGYVVGVGEAGYGLARSAAWRLKRTCRLQAVREIRRK